MAFRRTLIALERQPVVERMCETIPFVGAPIAAFMNKQTYAELKELREQPDPAAAVTYKFIEDQKKLVAYRLSRLSDEWEAFQDSPAPAGADGALLFVKTVVMSVVSFSFMFYVGSYGKGVELPVVGCLFGKPFVQPPALD
eukprot:TRINITY_DN734_c6_g1_i1.p1 TRINITY_DN734_c6_g1~~TRINITY_DN734_c6_g1_i1.p1  ORF type:complete len:141 (+),score=27.44 TRINITY_DN734_c6_g1_i1:99-521(+)